MKQIKTVTGDGQGRVSTYSAPRGWQVETTVREPGGIPRSCASQLQRMLTCRRTWLSRVGLKLFRYRVSKTGFSNLTNYMHRCMNVTANDASCSQLHRAGYKKLLPLFLFEELCVITVLYREVQLNKISTPAPWLLEWDGTRMAPGCQHLPVLSIQPVASPCQQADTSCGFLPMIPKRFKECSHLLLQI